MVSPAMAAPDPTPAHADHTMRCLEVWGGNRAVDTAIGMNGLDAWVYSRPYEGDEEGGDIHYLSNCASGRIARFLIADVAGHGAAVGKVATSLRDLMRRYINYVDQSRLVRGLNDEFSRLAEMGSFATAVALSYWTPTDEVTITNAGHPRPMLYRAASGEWEVVSDSQAPAAGPRNLPLGILELGAYDTTRVRLQPGDALLLYTDSLVEARDAAGRMLGEAGLLEILRTLDPSRPEALIPALMEKIVGQGSPPSDDITAVLIRPNSVKPRVCIMEGIRTSARVARASIGALAHGHAMPLPERSAKNVLGAFSRRLNR
jgi:sigma-B regulation protein RsbU (phosphoserine phosphatase)